MKHLDVSSPTIIEYDVGKKCASVNVYFGFLTEWPTHISRVGVSLPTQISVDGWVCACLWVGDFSRVPRFGFWKERGKKLPSLSALMAALLPWLEWADEQLATLKATLDNEAAEFNARLKASVTNRVTADIVQRVYSAYHAETKRRLNTEERVKALLKEAEDSARADIAFNWNEWWRRIDANDYVVIERERVKLPPDELIAAVDCGVIAAVNGLKDGTFTKPMNLTLRGG